MPLAPHAGLSFGTFDDRLRAVGGLWTGFGKGFSSTLIRDGENLRPTVDYRFRRHGFTFRWVSLENAGVAYTIEL